MMMSNPSNPQTRKQPVYRSRTSNMLVLFCGDNNDIGAELLPASRMHSHVKPGLPAGGEFAPISVRELSKANLSEHVFYFRQ